MPPMHLFFKITESKAGYRNRSAYDYLLDQDGRAKEATINR
jgi:hypothetical protein